METAVSSTRTLCTIYDLNNRLFINSLEKISDSDAAIQMNDSCNHILWNAGHTLTARYSMAQLAGMQVDVPFKDLFEHGKGIEPNAKYPSLNDIRSKWNAISTEFVKAVENMTDEQLNGPAPFQVPIQDQTMGGPIAFFAQHESCHIGINRKFLDYDAMSY